MPHILRFPAALSGGAPILSLGRPPARRSSPEFATSGVGVRVLGSQADVVATDAEGCVRDGCFIGLPYERMPDLAARALDACTTLGDRAGARRVARAALDALRTGGPLPEWEAPPLPSGGDPTLHLGGVLFPHREAGRDDIIGLGANGTVGVWGVGLRVAGPISEVVALRRGGAPMTGIVIRLPTNQLPGFAGLVLAAYIERNEFGGDRRSAHGRMADHAAVEAVLAA